MNNDMAYLKKKNDTKKIIRTELLFSPLLVILPLTVGLILIFDWYVRGLMECGIGFESELILGLIIIIGNLVFDVPFVKSLIEQLTKKKNK